MPESAKTSPRTTKVSGRRVCLLVLFLTQGFWLQSCGEIFSTKSVTPRPEAANIYQSLFEEKTPLEFELRESLLASTGDTLAQYVQKIRFGFKGEIELDGEPWFSMEMEVTDMAGGESYYSQSFLARIDKEGPEFLPDTGNSGLRFFLLRTRETAPAASVRNSWPEGVFPTLPGVLLADSRLDFSQGDLEFSRTLKGLDTVLYANMFQETWRVQETVSRAGANLLTADYLYGVSGLLACIQISAPLERRAAFGDDLGRAQVVRKFIRL